MKTSQPCIVAASDLIDNSAQLLIQNSVTPVATRRYTTKGETWARAALREVAGAERDAAAREGREAHPTNRSDGSAPRPIGIGGPDAQIWR